MNSLFPSLEQMSSEWHWISAKGRGVVPSVSFLVCDSRRVTPGCFFISLEADESLARAHLQEAAQKGALILGSSPSPFLETLASSYPQACWFSHPSPRKVWAWAASLWYPVQPAVLGAVTGTNGKTSVASFTRQLWSSLGHRAASLGTVGLLPQSLSDLLSPGLKERLTLTTPSPLDLSQCLQEIAHQSVTHVALEASSHGLHQHRLAGLRLQVAGFTNLTQDHLDYHKTMEAYLEAKSLLFKEILPSHGIAILNQDEACYPFLKELVQERCQRALTYSTKGEKGDLRLLSTHRQGPRQHLSLEVLGRAYEVSLPLLGDFQVANALCALGMVLATGAQESSAVEALESLKGEGGRLEEIGMTERGGQVWVDYAHTPDGLDKVLTALREGTAGRLWVVFGCGGNRDKGKRLLMGKIASQRADQVIITDDNPRGEDPGEIRSQIKKGCPEAWEIGDRKEAIETAVQKLEEGDVLLIAGKGHETGQIVGEKVLPFDDRFWARHFIGSDIK